MYMYTEIMCKISSRGTVLNARLPDPGVVVGSETNVQCIKYEQWLVLLALLS